MLPRMDASPHTLLIDDDREIRDLLSRFLERHGIRVTGVRETRRAWPTGAYHPVILDLMLPGEGGLDLARWLRGTSDVPIVMLTAIGEDTDRIAGLELGADDYLPKPFNPRELLARIRAVLRRTQERGPRQAAALRPLRFAGWTLDPARGAAEHTAIPELEQPAAAVAPEGDLHAQQRRPVGGGVRTPAGRPVAGPARRLPQSRPWASPPFIWAWLGITLAAAVLTLWAVRRLTAPVRLLGAAAERLGRDVNAPALPEDGPAEVAMTAAAFNTMASRIRRFVADRTFLLTAIGHDLHTAITRLKLRAEWTGDEEQRRKTLADLDELEAMVSATLAFGRDVAGTEPAVPMDLAVLLRKVLDEAAEARPGPAALTGWPSPGRNTWLSRPSQGH